MDVSVSNKVNKEESAVFVESVGGLLNSEAHILDTEIFLIFAPTWGIYFFLTFYRILLLL